jgi:hypothetical protein
MYIKTTVITAQAVLGAAALVCTLFAGIVAAKDHMVTVAVHVSTQGLDQLTRVAPSGKAI